MKIKILTLVVLYTLNSYAQKFEGLAKTPPMGWNSWNTFQTKLSEKLVMETADLFVSTGMKDAGYNYIVLDDGWMAMQRDSITGDLVADPIKFPHGMKYVADYVHAKGLKFGLYNCAGTFTCAGYPGTRGYEYQDARYYASVGTDYLKFDWCSTDGINAKEAYTTMSKALKKAGRPIVFSLCEWGNNKPWQWAKEVGQLWRSTGDITNIFVGYQDHVTWRQNGVLVIIDQEDSLRKYAGPTHWNDPDMLEVGNGMTVNEDRAHFSMWCMLAAPLIAGNDVRKMTKETEAILSNKDAIAIDQDMLGIQAFVYANKDSLETFVKPLANNEWAVCFLNRGLKPVPINFNWKTNIMTDSLFNKTLDATKVIYSIMNIWDKSKNTTTEKPLTALVAPHDVVMVKLIQKK
jgi:alpha-galactosidase